MRSFPKPIDKADKAAKAEYKKSGIAASNGRHAVSDYQVAGSGYKLGRRQITPVSAAFPLLCRSKRCNSKYQYHKKDELFQNKPLVKKIIYGPDQGQRPL